MKKYLLGLLVVLPLFLGGCGPQDNGLFHKTLVEPFIAMIKFFAGFFDNSYGMGLIIVTLIVRFVVMPFMFYSFKKQKKTQVKMKLIRPEMDAINKKIKSATTQEEKTQYTQEMMQLYRKHDVSPVNMGCLPILIQMPILMALYFAISHNPELASQNFLWFNLGTKDLTMTIIAGAMYLVQSLLSLRYMPAPDENDSDMAKQMNSQMKMMVFLSPAMILFVGLNMPAALPLYWAVGAVVLILQQYLSNRYFNYHEDELKHEVEEEEAKLEQTK